MTRNRSKALKAELCHNYDFVQEFRKNVTITARDIDPSIKLSTGKSRAFGDELPPVSTAHLTDDQAAALLHKLIHAPSYEHILSVCNCDRMCEVRFFGICMWPLWKLSLCSSSCTGRGRRKTKTWVREAESRGDFWVQIRKANKRRLSWKFLVFRLCRRFPLSFAGRPTSSVISEARRWNRGRK